MNLTAKASKEMAEKKKFKSLQNEFSDYFSPNFALFWNAYSRRNFCLFCGLKNNYQTLKIKKNEKFNQYHFSIIRSFNFIFL